MTNAPTPAPVHNARITQHVREVSNAVDGLNAVRAEFPSLPDDRVRLALLRDYLTRQGIRPTAEFRDPGPDGLTEDALGEAIGKARILIGMPLYTRIEPVFVRLVRNTLARLKVTHPGHVGLDGRRAKDGEVYIDREEMRSFACAVYAEAVLKRLDCLSGHLRSTVDVSGYVRLAVRQEINRRQGAANPGRRSLFRNLRGAAHCLRGGVVWWGGGNAWAEVNRCPLRFRAGPHDRLATDTELRDLIEGVCLDPEGWLSLREGGPTYRAQAERLRDGGRSPGLESAMQVFYHLGAAGGRLAVRLGDLTDAVDAKIASLHGMDEGEGPGGGPGADAGALIQALLADPSARAAATLRAWGRVTRDPRRRRKYDLVLREVLDWHDGRGPLKAARVADGLPEAFPSPDGHKRVSEVFAEMLAGLSNARLLRPGLAGGLAAAAGAGRAAGYLKVWDELWFWADHPGIAREPRELPDPVREAVLRVLADWKRDAGSLVGRARVDPAAVDRGEAAPAAVARYADAVARVAANRPAAGGKGRGGMGEADRLAADLVAAGVDEADLFTGLRDLLRALTEGNTGRGTK